jgi:hypothetical protein
MSRVRIHAVAATVARMSGDITSVLTEVPR